MEPGELLFVAARRVLGLARRGVGSMDVLLPAAIGPQGRAPPGVALGWSRATKRSSAQNR
jgi:hypothetical protein